MTQKTGALVMIGMAAGAGLETRGMVAKRWSPKTVHPALAPYRACDGQSGTIHLVPLESLRPTQVTVGMQSVHAKRRKIESRGRSAKDIEKLIARRPIPAVRGPDDFLYIIDHHHFGLALWKADVSRAYAEVVADRSSLTGSQFWAFMETKGFLHPFDEDDRRVDPGDLPDCLPALRADPYRDLAWAVREAGGFEKSTQPFAEFRWASFFRAHFTRRALERDPDGTVRKALKLCRSQDAAGLPGYSGERR